MRPKGFAEAKLINCGSDNTDCNCTWCEMFEAGADAMIEGLKKDVMTTVISGGTLQDGYIIPKPYTVNLIEKGYLVFIEEE